MTIQVSRARRGLFTLEEYATYRGEFISIDPPDTLVPLVDGFEPIIYMKCLINSHQFPVRPEEGERFMSYQDFINHDFMNDPPIVCPRCQEKDIRFKYCELEDQPRTWNDPNHRYVTTHRERVEHPMSPFFEHDGFIGIARPRWEDYFPPGHTNHLDPFAEHVVDTSTRENGMYSEGAQIAQSLPKQVAIPPEDVYDSSHTVLYKPKGEDLIELPLVERRVGKYLSIRQNYDFYRAILRVVSQYDIYNL